VFLHRGQSACHEIKKWVFTPVRVYRMGADFSTSYLGKFFEGLDYIWKSFNRDQSLLILGLDAAGKTAILYSMQLGEHIEYTVPTIGFNVEEIEVANLKIKMFDIGGQDKIRSLWPHYYQQSSGIVFVVDSNDKDRFEQAKQELHAVISHKDNVGKPLVVLANKQDLPYACGKDEMIQHLALDAIKTSNWYIVECCAVQNQKARIGFEWLANNM
jgi:small GTP-binding protein